MLLINLNPGQVIKVGERLQLKLCFIDAEKNSITLGEKLISETEYVKTNFKIGVSIQLTPDVVLTPTRIIFGREIKVSLGFDAPKNIAIRGEWLPKKNQNLKTLSVSELAALSKTGLEKELSKRLLQNK